MLLRVVPPHYNTTSNRPPSQVGVLHPRAQLCLHCLIDPLNPSIGLRMMRRSTNHAAFRPQMTNFSYYLCKQCFIHQTWWIKTPSLPKWLVFTAWNDVRCTATRNDINSAANVLALHSAPHHETHYHYPTAESLEDL